MVVSKHFHRHPVQVQPAKTVINDEFRCFFAVTLAPEFLVQADGEQPVTIFADFGDGALADELVCAFEGDQSVEGGFFSDSFEL